MQILRRSGHHACSGTRAYHVGKRYDVEGRNGRRPTDSHLSFRRVPATSNSSDLAGEYGSILGNGRRRRGRGAPSGGSLKVVTRGMRTRYVRKNGAPYSEIAFVTEYYDRTTEPN